MIIKCKMCGGDIEFTPGDTYGTCAYCSSVSTIPQAEDESKLNRYNRANHLRRQCEFDRAAAAYEKLLDQDETDAEAHWGAVISRFGIEYVEDPATGKRVPTCHRVQLASILADADYLAAVENAPDAGSREIYQAEAQRIAEIQRDILAISANEKPYDVFICYKETDDAGQRTRDSQWAQDVYYGLTDQGYKVFFSRITLEDKLGQQYEPYIFAALNSAKVMVVLGSRPEYFNAVWVKNEWSRFLALAEKDRHRLLIPCYRDMDPYDLPEELSSLQSQDMGKIGFMQDLIRGVKKVLDTGKVSPQQTGAVRGNAADAAEAAVMPGVMNLMKRVRLFLEDGDKQQAAEYINKVLDLDAEYAPAYAAKVLIRFGLKSEQELTTLRKSIDGDADWRKALRFADEKQKPVYEGYANTISDNEAYDREQERLAEEEERIATEKKRIAAEEKAKEEKYSAAVSAMDRHMYAAAIVMFNELGDFSESRENLRKCIDAYRQKLAAKEDVNRKTSVAMATEKVNSAQQAVSSARITVNKAEKEKKETEKREREIPDEIRKLSDELIRVHGLFSSGKKRELEKQIEALKQELTGMEQKKRKCDEALQAAGTELSNAESVLTEAKAALAKVETEMLKNGLTRWPDEAVISAAAAAAARLATLKTPGKYVTFGNYRQGNSSTKEPVEWLVLSYNTSTNRTLLISRYELDAKPYNTDFTEVTWETCTLRTWLNGEFLNAAFSAEEQKAIPTVTVSADKNPSYSTNPGNATQDKVFCLSIAEVNKYFKNIEARKGAPTQYAINNNAYTSSSYKVDGKTTCCWWLRSPGCPSHNAAIVGNVGYVGDYGTYVNYSNYAVRPALYIDLNLIP